MKLLQTRIVIETTSPLVINNQDSVTNKNILHTDVNGLPVIPATGLKGVWRQAIARNFSRDKVDADLWFGKTN